jgi:hypothetical protein
MADRNEQKTGGLESFSLLRIESSFDQDEDKKPNISIK